jgi:hypothetical protein
MPSTVEQRWNLIGSGLDSYIGQNCQDPRTSRVIQSWIPSDNGELTREWAEPAYASNTVSGPICGLYEFDQNVTAVGTAAATIVRYYFAAARTNSTVGTKTCNLYQMVSGAWTQVTAVGTLADVPMVVVQEDNMFLVDGENNWLFDGTVWVECGMQIPLNPPAINISNGSAQVYFDNGTYTDFDGVTFDLFSSAPDYQGTVSISYPAGTPTSSTNVTVADGCSLLFNPQAYNGTLDPNVQPMEWATLNTSGGITGYTTVSGATNHYNAAISCALVIPAPGSYTITFIHDDGAFFGFGPGAQQGATPYLTKGDTTNVFQTATAVNNYSAALAGTSYSCNHNGGNVWQETFVIYFPNADCYPLEIDYTNWENNQCLIFQIAPNGSSGITPNPNVLPLPSGTISQINASIGKYYWFTNADQTTGVATESSSSPIGVVSGPLVGGTVDVYQQPGLFTSSSSSKTVTGSNSTDNPGPVSPDLNPTMAGQVLYINGTLIGTIASVGVGATLSLTSVTNPIDGNAVYTGTITGGKNDGLVGSIFTITGFSNAGNNITDAVCIASTLTTITFANASSVAETHAASATSPATTLVLEANAAANETDGRAVICDARATHWYVYASESDGSKVGQLLSLPCPVTQDLATTPYSDTSPFLSSANNSYLPIFRPLRNDPPVPSKLLEVHKVCQWRREEFSPNFFAFTANEEVTSGNNGDPAQCLPGCNTNTVSDMVNVISFPNQATQIRSLISHVDALYMFSEKSCYLLYGQSVDDFGISQTQTFAQGIAGRFAGKSTPNGLVFVSYDKRAFLYPTSLYASYLSQAGAATTALQEIGKPMRNKFALMDPNRLDEVVTEHYHFGIRDWWVVAFPQTDGTYVTYVWDFNDRGWFQLQRGFASLAVFEVSNGCLVLVGGDINGNTWVIDDQTGTYASDAALPIATWRPALIDFGDTSKAHLFKHIELEFDSAALAQNITITAWLDPLSVDSPGVGRIMYLRPALGANRYRAFLTGNATCQRMLLQVQAASTANAGAIRGVMLVAQTVPGMIGGDNKFGGA